MGEWQVLETVAVADCALEIRGADLDDLFATAARALAELMVDPATLEIRNERPVELSAPALDLLLYDWLSELIYLKDLEQAVFPRAEVRVEPGVPSRLRARLAGGRIERGRTVLRADLKAVTFHQFDLARDASGWRARVVLDL